MAKRKRHQRQGGRTTPKGTRPQQWQGDDRHLHAVDDDEPDIEVELREALRQPTPWMLQAMASSMVESLTERSNRSGPFAPPTRDPDPVTLEEFLGGTADMPTREGAALFRALVPLVEDDDLRTRYLRRLDERPAPSNLPRWIGDLTDPRPAQAVLMRDDYGDGDNVLIEVGWGPTSAATIIAYVDHHLGSMVKDAFMLPDDLGQVRNHYEQAADHDITWEPLDLADARAILERGIERHAMTVPEVESDTWPFCRPIVTQVLRAMPAGGTVDERAEPDDASIDAIVNRFWHSPHAAPLRDQPDARALVEPLLWFATSYDTGDPLRWSPISVEIVLASWYARKVAAPPEDLAIVPLVLRCFVRFAHAETGMRPDLTVETLAAADRWEPTFLAALAELDGGWDDGYDDFGDFGDFGDDPYADLTHDERMTLLFAKLRDGLIEQLGGQEVADALDAEPLPDEPFDWSVVPGDLTERVQEILDVADVAAIDVADIEVRTATRRLLARVAEVAPDSLRRRGRSDIWAAALLGIIGRQNAAMFRTRKIYGTTIAAACGVKHGSLGQKVGTIVNAIDLPPYDVSLLHSEERRALLRRLDVDTRRR